MKFKLYVFLLFFSTQAICQTKVKPKLYAKDLKNANLYFTTEDYLHAILIYKKVLAVDPTNETANLNSAISRIRLNQSADSIRRNLQLIKSSTIPEVKFYTGLLSHLSSDFEEAINDYTTYKSISVKLRSISDEEVNYYISCSQNAQFLVNAPHRSVIKNMGNKINSSYDEYVPLITPDESVMFFTSRRQGSTGDLKDGDGKYYEDVYMVKRMDEKWGEPKNVGPPINTNTHDACVALSFDGNQMMIYRTAADKVTGDLYICHTDFVGWTEPKKLGAEINTPFIETSACFSNDTSVIYFSSNKPGGYGGKDLYRIKKLPNGKWSVPMNLGPVINTARDEDAPYLHPDGEHLYFSSKGHTTMGDYDIFKTSLNPETSEFSPPENLGYPINTVYSDRFFVLNANGTKGYYSSVKDETFGGQDIYEIDTRFGDNDLKVKKGKVMIGNSVSKAKITLIDLENKQISGIFNASATTGKFLLVVNPVKAYKVIIEEEGCQTMILDLDPLVNEREDNELILSLTKKKQN